MAFKERAGTGAGGPGNPEAGGNVPGQAAIEADKRLILISTGTWLAALVLSGLDFYFLRHMLFNLPMTLIGVVFVVAGMVISRRVKRQLGPFFGPGLRIQEDHYLVKDGLYKNIRHPSVTADLLFDLGITLVVSSIYGFCLMLLVIPPTILRVKLEEQMLIRRFGYEYQEYISATKKFIPGIY